MVRIAVLSEQVSSQIRTANVDRPRELQKKAADPGQIRHLGVRERNPTPETRRAQALSLEQRLADALELGTVRRQDLGRALVLVHHDVADLGVDVGLALGEGLLGKKEEDVELFVQAAERLGGREVFGEPAGQPVTAPANI